VISINYTGDAESPACKNAANWAARQLDPLDTLDPVAVGAYLADWKAYAAVGVAAAPDALTGSWLIYATSLSSMAEALATRGNDVARLEAEDPTNAVLFGENTPGYVAEIASWEQEVCGAGDQPVTDAAPDGDIALCDALAPLLDASAAAVDGGSNPAQIEAIGSAYRALAASPPSGTQSLIEDISRTATWMSEHYATPLQTIRWDLRRFYRESSGVDRVAASGWTPEIRDAIGRVNAFADEVCVAPDVAGDGG